MVLFSETFLKSVYLYVMYWPEINKELFYCIGMSRINDQPR